MKIEILLLRPTCCKGLVPYITTVRTVVAPTYRPRDHRLPRTRTPALASPDPALDQPLNSFQQPPAVVDPWPIKPPRAAGSRTGNRPRPNRTLAPPAGDRLFLTDNNRVPSSPRLFTWAREQPDIRPCRGTPDNHAIPSHSRTSSLTWPPGGAGGTGRRRTGLRRPTRQLHRSHPQPPELL